MSILGIVNLPCASALHSTQAPGSYFIDGAMEVSGIVDLMTVLCPLIKSQG